MTSATQAVALLYERLRRSECRYLEDIKVLTDGHRSALRLLVGEATAVVMASLTASDAVAEDEQAGTTQPAPLVESAPEPSLVLAAGSQEPTAPPMEPESAPSLPQAEQPLSGDKRRQSKPGTAPAPKRARALRVPAESTAQPPCSSTELPESLKQEAAVASTTQQRPPTQTARITRSLQAANSKGRHAEQTSRTQHHQQQATREAGLSEDPSQPPRPQADPPQQQPNTIDLHAASELQEQDPGDQTAGNTGEPTVLGSSGQQLQPAVADGLSQQLLEPAAEAAASSGAAQEHKPARQRTCAKRANAAQPKQKTAAKKAAAKKATAVAPPELPQHEPLNTKPPSPAQLQATQEPGSRHSDIMEGTSPAAAAAAACIQGMTRAPEGSAGSPAPTRSETAVQEAPTTLPSVPCCQGLSQDQARDHAQAPAADASEAQQSPDCAGGPHGARAAADPDDSTTAAGDPEALEAAAATDAEAVPGSVAAEEMAAVAEAAAGSPPSSMAARAVEPEPAAQQQAAAESAGMGGALSPRSEGGEAPPSSLGSTHPSPACGQPPAAPSPRAGAAEAASPAPTCSPSQAVRRESGCALDDDGAGSSPTFQPRGSPCGRGVSAAPLLALPGHPEEPSSEAQLLAVASPVFFEAAAGHLPSPPGHATLSAMPLPSSPLAPVELLAPRLRDGSFGGFSFTCAAAAADGQQVQVGTPAIQASDFSFSAPCDSQVAEGMAEPGQAVHSAFGSPQPQSAGHAPETAAGIRGAEDAAAPQPGSPGDGGDVAAPAAAAPTPRRLDGGKGCMAGAALAADRVLAAAGAGDGCAPAPAIDAAAAGGVRKTAGAGAGSNVVAAVRSFLPAKRVLSPQIAAGKKQIKVKALETAQAAKRAEEAKAADRVRAKEEQCLMRQQQQLPPPLKFTEADLSSPLPLRTGAAGGVLVKARAAALQQQRMHAEAEEACRAEDTNKKDDKDREAAATKLGRRQASGMGAQPANAQPDKHQAFSNVRLQPFSLQAADKGKRHEQGQAALGHAAVPSQQQQQRPDVNDKHRRAETRRREEEERRRAELEAKQRMKEDRNKAAKSLQQQQQQQQHGLSKREGGREPAAAAILTVPVCQEAMAVGAAIAAKGADALAVPLLSATSAAAAVNKATTASQQAGSQAFAPSCAAGTSGGALLPRSMNAQAAGAAAAAVARNDAAGMDDKGTCIPSSAAATPNFKSDKEGPAQQQHAPVHSTLKPGLAPACALTGASHQPPMTPAEAAEEQRNIQMLVSSPYVNAGNARTPGLRAGATNQVLSYDISPYRSDSEDDEVCNAGGARKPVPDWAQAANLMGQLQRQQLVDPDKLFGTRMKTCPLDAIFEGVPVLPPPDPLKASKRRDWRKRGSTGDWIKDRLTWQEEINYKKAMGYCL